MSFRVVDYDELDADQRTQASCLEMMAFGGSGDDRRVRTMRGRGTGVAPYYGMYALDGEDVLGQVLVHRFNFVFPDGTSRPVSGLAGITTRPDRARRGVARSIIRAVLEREEGDGIDHSLLWTNRSWHAHDLYTSLGFRDIFSPPLAYRRIPQRRQVAGAVSFARCGRKDVRSIVKMHARASEGRTGFASRPPGILGALVDSDSLPLKPLVIARRGGRALGYLYMEKHAGISRCREMVALPGTDEEELAAAAEASFGRGRIFMFRNVFNMSPPGWLGRRGYSVFPSSWQLLMGRAPGRNIGERKAAGIFGTSSASFSCQSGDAF